MKKEYQKLAKEAGFIFWKNESWKPDGQIIDWSCNYDEEIQVLIDLVIKECSKNEQRTGQQNKK